MERWKTTTRVSLRQINASINRLIPAAVYRSGGQRLGSVMNNVSVQNMIEGGNVGGASNDDTNGAQSNVVRVRQEVPFISSLVKNPKTLHVLWEEWEFGVSGRKPAKLFNSMERGASKSAYSFRKGFWELCNGMIARGYSSSTAIDKIYSVYGGNLSVSKLLCLINKDQKDGGHIQLRGATVVTV